MRSNICGALKHSETAQPGHSNPCRGSNSVLCRFNYSHADQLHISVM